MNYNFNMGSIYFSHGYFFLSRNARKFIAARWFYLPQITQITRIFASGFNDSLKILFCLGKSLTYNKIRYLTASNALYGFAQIFALRHLFFLDMKTREHDFFSLRLFSPTDYTDNTDFCLRI